MQEVYSRDEEKYLKIGLWVALAIFIVIGLSLLRRDVTNVDGGKYYDVNARFNRTDGLLVGDWVRMAGMNIGKVIDAKLDEHYKAILTLEVKDGIKIPDDSSASIVSSGLMGPKYIEIEPGGSEDYIPQNGEFSYTQDAMVIDELLDRIVSMGKANRKKMMQNCQKCQEQQSQLNIKKEINQGEF